MRIEWSEFAQHDIWHLYDFIADANLDAAERALALILKNLLGLVTTLKLAVSRRMSPHKEDGFFDSGQKLILCATKYMTIIFLSPASGMALKSINYFAPASATSMTRSKLPPHILPISASL